MACTMFVDSSLFCGRSSCSSTCGRLASSSEASSSSSRDRNSTAFEIPCRSRDHYERERRRFQECSVRSPPDSSDLCSLSSSIFQDDSKRRLLCGSLVPPPSFRDPPKASPNTPTLPSSEEPQDNTFPNLPNTAQHSSSNAEEEELDPSIWKEHLLHSSSNGRGRHSGVPVYIMLPLDSVTMNNTLSRPRAFLASLTALKSAGVEGVMMDVWWGIVEKDVPLKYEWGAYKELIGLVKDAGLKLQAVMSFHQCGGNVGDHCIIPLPRWAMEEIDLDPDIVYTDKAGRRNREYISLGCDSLPVLRGRTPIQVYSDFMRSFRDQFKDYLGEVITEIQVGMGPAGELRYPAYPESNSKWRFPGIGEFQCYDKYMLGSLRAAAEMVGRPHWGFGGPHDAGCYNQWPNETGFFHQAGSWNSKYGRFFLQWYSDMLIKHGDRVLSSAAGIFRGHNTHISGKVAGIHWHYGTHSHAAELTAGYYNTVHRDGYLPIAHMFSRHGSTLNFTCIEMRDSEQPMYALCSPEGLLRQVVKAAKSAGVRVSGENALPRFDEAAHEQIVRKSRLQLEDVCMDEPMSSFTFLRMSERLFRPENWRNFVLFVRHMREGRTFSPWEAEHHHSNMHFNSTSPLSRKAAELMLQ